MAVFSDLPYEIVILIISQLDYHCHKSQFDLPKEDTNPPRLQDLFNVSLVSRLLRAASEPFLFRLIFLGGGRRRQPPWNFITLILSRPSLAANVELLSIGWWGAPGQLEDMFPQRNPNDLTLFAAAAEKAGLDLSPSLYSDQLILLLQLLHNLKALVVIIPPRVDKFGRFLLENVSSALLSSATLSPSLRGLRHYSHLRYDGTSPTVLNYIAPMFSLPSIRSIEAHDLRAHPLYIMRPHKVGEDPENLVSEEGEDRQDIPRYKCYYGSSVTKLVFKSADIHGGILEEIFRIPRALTHFEYESEEYGEFSGHAFRRAFLVIKPTLQHLKIFLRRVTPSAGDIDFGVGPFNDFPALRTICCDSHTLIRPGRLGSMLPPTLAELRLIQPGRLVSMLPPTLEELTLRLPWALMGGEVENLSVLLEQKELEFPRLGVITLYEGEPVRNLRLGALSAKVDTLKKHKEALRAMSKSVGVKLFIKSSDPL